MLGIENFEFPSVGQKEDNESTVEDKRERASEIKAEKREMKALTDCNENGILCDAVDLDSSRLDASVNLSLRLDLSSDTSDQISPTGKETHRREHDDALPKVDETVEDADSDKENAVKQKRKRVMISSDDESDSEDAPNLKVDEKKKSPESKMTASDDSSQQSAQVGDLKEQPSKDLDVDIYDAETDESDDDDLANSSRSSGKTKRVIIHSSDEEDKEETTIMRSKKMSKQVLESDLYDADGSDEDDEDRQTKVKVSKKVKNSSILSEDEDDEQLLGQDDDFMAGSLDNADEEMQAISKGRKKKGSRSPKPRKLKKEAIQKIHSESQRIVRESQVRLPYHKPKPLTLDEFFSKRPSGMALKPLKGLRGMQEQEVEKVKKNLKANNEEILIDPYLKRAETEGKDVKIDGNSKIYTNEQLATEIEAVGVIDNLLGERTSMSVDDAEEDTSNLDKDFHDTQIIEETISPSRENLRTESTMNLDLHLSVETMPTQRTQECPDFVETNKNNVLKEMTSPRSSLQDSHTSIENGAKTKEDQTLDPIVSETSDNCDIKVSSVESKNTHNDGIDSKRKTAFKMLQESLAKLKNLKPVISGETAGVIDLSEEEKGAPVSSGVEKLMNRFTKHALVKERKKYTENKEVQISIVRKEVGADGKENLKQEFVPVKLEAEEHEDDIKMKIPGAKLLKLKQNLQAKMKVRREEERQKRKEAYRLDNEEMLEDENDGNEEEADMTDDESSDEDYRAEDEDDDDEEDDDDDDLVDYNINDHKKKSEYFDEEAEDDDDDDDEDDEENHGDDEEMASDSENDEISPSRKLTKKVKRRQVLSDDDDDLIKTDAIKEGTKADKSVEDVDFSIIPPAETTNLSSISSKTSSLRRSDAGSLVLFPTDVGKTMDLYDSTTSFPDENESVENEKLTFNLGQVKTASDGAKPNNLQADQGNTVKLFDSSSSSQLESIVNDDSTRERLPSLKPTLDRQDSADSKVSDVSVEAPSCSSEFDASFEMFPSTIPPFQPQRDSTEDTKDKEEFTPFSSHQNLFTRPKDPSKPSLLTLPVEDSQDLFRLDSPILSSDFNKESETQSFKFSFEEDFTQTQFLDENGFLNTKSSTKPPAVNQIFTDENASQGNMAELLDLCSGKFSSAPPNNTQKPPTSFKKGLFSDVNTQDNMDELIGLCSGNFSMSKPSTQKTEDEKSAESDAASEASFGIQSDNELTNQNQMEAKPEDGLSSDDEPIVITRKKKKIKKKPQQMILQAGDDEDLHLAFESDEELQTTDERRFEKLAKRKFFEQEAELSGSEFDSDENYDAEDLGDELEIDKEAEEDVKDTDELREQVNKIYMKNVDDEDARRLRIYKEMYLPDGDLYSEGKGRIRKFRWKHLDEEGSEGEKGANASDDEEDEEGEEDTQWRLQRYQREQWLKDKENKGEIKKATAEPEDIEFMQDESSQFDLFMKSAVRNQRKGSTSTQSSSSDGKQPEKPAPATKGFNSPKPFKRLRHGSFLKRNKEELEKLASVAKPMTNPGGNKSSRGFVFQSLSQNSNDATAPTPPPQLKRSISLTEPSGLQSKRPKLDRILSQQKPASIFNHL